MNKGGEGLWTGEFKISVGREARRSQLKSDLKKPRRTRFMPFPDGAYDWPAWASFLCGSGRELQHEDARAGAVTLNGGVNKSRGCGYGSQKADAVADAVGGFLPEGQCTVV